VYIPPIGRVKKTYSTVKGLKALLHIWFIGHVFIVNSLIWANPITYIGILFYQPGKNWAIFYPLGKKEWLQ